MAEKSWWEQATDAAGSVGSTVGSKGAEAFSDWLDRSLGAEQQKESQRQQERFAYGPALRRYPEIERDQNVGARPADPKDRYATPQEPKQGSAGGLAGILSSPLGLMMLIGTGVYIVMNR